MRECMDMRVTQFDWTLIQAFIAVAETGSLSAAARTLGASQPTIGRQIKSLEAQVGSELFVRQARGLVLSEKGRRLLPAAQRMRDTAGELALIAAGQDEALAGTVRITASVFTAQYALPPVIAKLRAEEPDIAIELVATDDANNLLFREADIAVRMFRPTQLELVTKHIGNLELGLFAAKSYLNRVDVDLTPETIFDLDWVGYDRSERIIKGLQSRGIDVTRDFFATRCDDHNTYWELVRAGCGLGFSQKHVAHRHDDVVEVIPDLDIPVLEVWLAVHESLRHTPRVRRVWDALEDGLRPALSPPS